MGYRKEHPLTSNHSLLIAILNFSSPLQLPEKINNESYSQIHSRNRMGEADDKMKYSAQMGDDVWDAKSYL